VGRCRIDQIGLDCSDLDRLIAFWTDALAYEVQDLEVGAYAVLRDPQRKDPRLFLQVVPEPKAGKNRMHLDIDVPDEAEAVERLHGLGAITLWREDMGECFWTVLADPEGNEFCVGTFNPEDPPPA
jgi:catechol 2,3-dioxygenase-like lactoylglutathione lyase family enzyme